MCSLSAIYLRVLFQVFSDKADDRSRYVAVCRVGRPDVPCSFVLFGDGECCDSCHDITDNRCTGQEINVRLPNVNDFESAANARDFVDAGVWDLRGVCGLFSVSRLLCGWILVNAG